MKVKTLRRFRDKDNFNNIHEVGSEFECTNERGNYLIGLGFVEKVKVAPVESAPKVELAGDKVEMAGDTTGVVVDNEPKPIHSGKKKNRPYEGKKN